MCFFLLFPLRGSKKEKKKKKEENYEIIFLNVRKGFDIVLSACVARK